MGAECGRGIPVGEDARNGAANQRLHVRYHSGQRVPVIGIAWQRLHMGDEPATLGWLRVVATETLTLNS